MMNRFFVSLLLILFVGLNLSFGQNIIMNNTGTVEGITEDTRYFYDPGGRTGDFGENIRDTLVMRDNVSNSTMHIVFDDFAMGYGDTLYIFDGQGTNGTLIGFYNSVFSPEELTSTTGFFTFVFHSDSINDYGILKSGWAARAYVVANMPEALVLNDAGSEFTLVSCNGKFYDSGGPDGNMLYTSGTRWCEFTSPVSHVKMEFQSFNVAGVMKIYDGSQADPDKRLIGQFHSSTLDATHKPPVLFSSGSTLLVEYVSASGDMGRSGWEATITCVPELFESPEGSACPKVVSEDESGEELPDTIHHVCGVPVIVSAHVTATGRYTNDYTVRPIPFELHPYEFNEGTQVSASYDDKWLASVNLPFQFSFFGINYSTVYPGTNGIISFNYREALSGLTWSYAPPADSPPYTTPSHSGGTPDPNTPHCFKNSIYGVFEDIDIQCQGLGGVYRDTLGVYPCRTFVFNFNEIPEFYCETNPNRCTYQMVLYEGTNIIDIFIKKRQCCASTNGPNNNNEGIIGIQNNTSSQILIAPGRGMTGWSVQENQSEAWRFTPITPMDEDAEIEWFTNTVSDSTSVGHTKKIVLDPQETTDYIVKYHFTNAGNNQFDLYDTIHVIVDVPDLSLDTFTVCPGKTVTLVPIFGDTTDVHPQNYYWSTSATSDTLSFVARETQEYELKVLFDNNCQRSTRTIVNVDTMAIPRISGDSVICLGEKVRLVAAVDDPTYILRWGNGQETDVLVLQPMDTSTYTIKAVLPDDEECFTTDTFTVYVSPLPELSFSYSPDEVIIERGVGTLYCHTDCDPDYDIVWNFHDRYDPDNSIVEDQHSVTHEFTHVGSYDITLSGTNQYDCVDSVTEHVRVFVPVSFVVPNAFTPNDDGLNDVFIPVYEGIELTQYLMLIYDRSGQLVFKSTNCNVGWDGTDLNGNPCPQGVYSYFIHHWTQMDNLQGTGQPAISGGVTLIR